MTDPEPRVGETGHIGAIAAIHARADKRVGHHQRFIERLASQIGRPRTLYTMLALVAVWMAVNLLRAKPWDAPPFFALQGVLALYAAIVTTIVLTAQNRQQRDSEHKSYVELQVTLSSEQKAAKIIELLEELRRDLPDVVNRRDTQAEIMSRAVDAHAVISVVEQTLERSHERHSVAAAVTEVEPPA